MEVRDKVVELWKTSVSVVATRYSDDPEARKMLSQMLDVSNVSEEMLRLVMSSPSSSKSKKNQQASIMSSMREIFLAPPDAAPSSVVMGTEEETMVTKVSEDGERGIEEPDDIAAPLRSLSDSLPHVATTEDINAVNASSSSVETSAAAAECSPGGVFVVAKS